MKQAKVWGFTSPIFQNSNFEVHRIEANKGGYCSEHIHEYKYNMFYIESGKLKVTSFYNDEENEVILNANETTTVEPNMYHKFEALEDTIAYEIYYTHLDPNDIVRRCDGGKNG